MQRTKNKIQYARTIDIIIYSALAIFFFLNILSFDFSGADGLVVGSFILMGLFFFYRIVSAKKNISLYRVYYIFAFIFLFYAPLQQYLSGTVFQLSNGWTLIYDNNDYLQANVLIIVFTVCFEFGYKLTHYKTTVKNKTYLAQPTDFSMLVSMFISFAVVLFLYATGNITGRAGYDVENASISHQINNILRFFPISCFIVTILQGRKSGYINKPIFIIYLLEVVIVFFPFNGSISRFLLFGAYLAIFSLFFSKSQCKSLFFLLYVVGFFFVFSAFNYFKSNTLEDLSGFALSLVDFNFMDFDAYQILMASMNYVEHVDIMYGQNILTALLCFIPRSVWTGKLDPSGQIVAEYWGTWFTNVSCPLPAEFFLAFGYFGVIIGGFLIGFLFKKIDGFDYSNSYLKKGLFCVLSGLLVYILRGALLPVTSYSVALVISLILVCCINIICSKFCISKKPLWVNQPSYSFEYR